VYGVLCYNMSMNALQREKLTSFLLRAGLAGVFLYAAFAAFIDPDSWVGFLPQFVSDFADPKFILSVFSIYEILLALWLLSGKESFHAALLSAATLFALVVQNIGALDILFRDFAIFMMALALTSLSASHEKRHRRHLHGGHHPHDNHHNQSPLP
jgi:hypothetical protein